MHDAEISITGKAFSFMSLFVPKYLCRPNLLTLKRDLDEVFSLAHAPNVPLRSSLCVCEALFRRW